MELDGRVLAAIVGMALVTYATRAGGFWLLGRVRLSRQVDAWLRQVPGAVLATVLVTARTGNVLFGMATGVGAVVVLRRLV